ncbi:MULTISPECIES: universal stress protein [unclassified Flavobacterium]|uniref:universal stress protein n=1 Tax=unclassified Flavobacterium TaxID=196869 RepID=UPI00131A63DC|nr:MULTISPECIES: universal stress protein [unclassified Flavobacterium]
MKYEIKNILVPTDFSDCANNALKVAIGMAKRHNATLHLLHSVEPIYFGRTYNVLGSMVDLQSTMVNIGTTNLLVHEQKIVSVQGINVNTFCAVGSVSSIVDNYVIEHNIDLVVMGTHGANGFKEFFAGSNTYDVIKSATCPVLSIPQSFDKTGFNSILFPIRAVDGVIEKYDYIKPIVEKNDAVIHILGVAFENDMQERYAVNVDFDTVKKAINHDATYMTYEAVQSTDIADTILAVANKRNDDLMIINATLDKKWYQFFKGNYTQKIINHSKIPVLSVKPELTPVLVEIVQQYAVAQASSYAPLTIQPIY